MAVRLSLNPGGGRADDSAVITSLGGTPFALGDGFDGRRNALYRVELEIGRQFDAFRMEWHLDESYPSALDEWLMGRGTTMLLTFQSALITGTTPVAFAEVASTTLHDAKIDEAAAAVKSLVDDFAPDIFWYGFQQEPSRGGWRLKAEVAQTANVGSTTLRLRTRAGVGLVKNIATGAVLSFVSGKTATLTAGFTAASPWSDPSTLTVAPLTQQILAGDTVTIETTAQWQASFRTAFQKVFDRSEVVWSGWANRSKVQRMWILFQNGFSTSPLNWYPGDTYVDAVGVDVYNQFGRGTAEPWEDFQDQIIDNSVKTFVAAHGKRAVCTEVGVLEGIQLHITGGPYGPSASPVTVSCTAINDAVSAGWEVVVFNADGSIKTIAILNAAAADNATSVQVSSLAVQILSTDQAAIRPAGVSKHDWFINARDWIPSWPELDAFSYFLTGIWGNWLEQPWQGSDDGLAGFAELAASLGTNLGIANVSSATTTVETGKKNGRGTAASSSATSAVATGAATTPGSVSVSTATSASTTGKAKHSSGVLVTSSVSATVRGHSVFDPPRRAVLLFGDSGDLTDLHDVVKTPSNHTLIALNLPNPDFPEGKAWGGTAYDPVSNILISCDAAQGLDPLRPTGRELGFNIFDPEDWSVAHVPVPTTLGAMETVGSTGLVGGAYCADVAMAQVSGAPWACFVVHPYSPLNEWDFDTYGQYPSLFVAREINGVWDYDPAHSWTGDDLAAMNAMAFQAFPIVTNSFDQEYHDTLGLIEVEATPSSQVLLACQYFVNRSNRPEQQAGAVLAFDPATGEVLAYYQPTYLGTDPKVATLHPLFIAVSPRVLDDGRELFSVVYDTSGPTGLAPFQIMQFFFYDSATVTIQPASNFLRYSTQSESFAGGGFDDEGNWWAWPRDGESHSEEIAMWKAVDGLPKQTREFYAWGVR